MDKKLSCAQQALLQMSFIYSEEKQNEEEMLSSLHEKQELIEFQWNEVEVLVEEERIRKR